MAPSRRVVLDDRLLIEELLDPRWSRRGDLYTTSYWYYRACRAAVLGAGGHLSGPFELVDRSHQDRALVSLLELRDDIALSDPRSVVPVMVEMAGRHPRLNLLNLEAVAVGRLLPATLWLSEASASGLLPAVLDAEGVAWQTVAVT